MAETKKKNGFASGIGFILAAAGSAVGLGNIWGFPYKTAKYGGAAFVLVYVLCVLFIGSIALVAEIYLGKRAQANTVTAYKKVKKGFGWVGLLVCVIPVFIACYYSVLGGWTFRYAMNSFQSVGSASNALTFGSFVSNPYEPVIYTVIFMALAALIIMGGIKGGIEKASKVLMPILFIIIVAIAIYSLTLGPGVEKGLEFYLVPKFENLTFDGVIAAMGQAFYSLSLGMGIMVAYGSYTGKEIKIGKSIAMISVFDTLIALLAGLAIFPAVGALAPELFDTPDALGGVGLVYKVLPMIFERMGDIGQFISFFFFAMIVIAAVTSVISLVETGVQFVIQKFKAPRKIATLAVCGLCCLVSIPVAWSVGGAFDGSIMVFGYDILTFMDDMTNVVLMPIGAFCSCFAIGWLIDDKVTANPFKTLDNLKNDGLDLHPLFGGIFAVMVKYVTPLLILFIEIVGVLTRVVPALGGTINFWFTIGFAVLLAVLSIIVYFVAFVNQDTGTNEDELAINVKEKAEIEVEA